MGSDANREAPRPRTWVLHLALPMGRFEPVQEEVLVRPGRFRRTSERVAVKENLGGEGERRRRDIVCPNRQAAKRQRWT